MAEHFKHWKELASILTRPDTVRELYTARCTPLEKMIDTNRPSVICGERVFLGFYNLGRSLLFTSTGNPVSQAVQDRDTSELVDQVKSFVKTHIDWLEDCILFYLDKNIQLNGDFSEDDICRTRFGIQFLIENFRNISTAFDKVLDTLVEGGDLKVCFDGRLRALDGFPRLKWDVNDWKQFEDKLLKQNRVRRALM